MGGIIFNFENRGVNGFHVADVLGEFESRIRTGRSTSFRGNDCRIVDERYKHVMD